MQRRLEGGDGCSTVGHASLLWMRYFWMLRGDRRLMVQIVVDGCLLQYHSGKVLSKLNTILSYYR